MPKPVLYGPLIRAAVLGFVAFFALKGPFTVMADEARYPHPSLPANYMTYVWGTALAVFLVFGLLAFRVAMEAFPPKGTQYFPVRRNITMVDMLVSPVALLLLLIVGLFPQMWINPSGGFGPRNMDIQQLLVITPMGLALLLWRPMWSITRGQPLTRFPAGPWLPWRQPFPVKVRVEWEGFWTGKQPRVQTAWQLIAHLGELTIDLEVVGLNTPQATLDSIAREWEAQLDTGVVGDAAAQHAALHRKKVMPWHMLAAIFGVPGLVLMLHLLFTSDPHRSDEPREGVRWFTIEAELLPAISALP